jgi:Fe-S cluster assembly protein SufD
MSRDVSRRTTASQFATDGVLARLTADDVPGPDWLAPPRRAALAWVAEHGFPTAKHEDWRDTRLAPILGATLEAAAVSGPDDPDDAVRDAVAGTMDLDGPRLVFVNGRYRADLSTVGGLPKGATVVPLADALLTERALLEPVLPANDTLHAFAAVNTALAPDGVFVHLAAQTFVPAPIHLIYVADPGSDGLLASPRAVFLLDDGSRVQIVESHLGTVSADPADTHCTNAVTDVRLGPDSTLEHYKLQYLPETAYHLALLDVVAQAGSTFTSHSAMLGAAIARHEVRVRFAGEGAAARLDGVYLPRGEQVHDNTVFVDHAVPGCTSHQLYKGVLSDSGRGVFNGHIMVREGAGGTDAHQTNKNLLLSDRAEADTRPRLEIYTDDVKCTHGAAVGQLDEDAVLYLRARGIPEPDARRVLVRAFVAEMVERIGLAPVRDRLAQLLDGPRQ